MSYAHIPVVIAGAYFAVFFLALSWNIVASIVAVLLAAVRIRHGPDEPSPLDPAVVITLVHGTWARRASWTLSSSPLCRTLSQAASGPVAFSRFTWSGTNSISARRRAVKRLVSHIHGLITRWPQARHYLVGHSHGGNVAFQALTDSIVSERVAGLACLSTPFLTAAPRDLGPVGETVLWWLPVVTIFYGGLFVVEQLIPAHSDTLAGVLILVAFMTGYLVSPLIDRLSRSALESLEYPTADPSRILILRTAGDEAAAVLGATHVISWAAGRIWLTTSRALSQTLETVERWRGILMRHWLVTALVGTGLVAVGVGALLQSSGADAPAWMGPVLGVSTSLLLLIVATIVRGGLVAAVFGRVVLAIVAAPFLMLIALFGIGVGPELVVAGLLLQVTAETTPPGRWVVWQVAPSTSEPYKPEGTLMHSASYQDQKSLEILEQWFSAAERKAELMKGNT